ncbi:MAG TPA: sulfite exporter TauE/SafE family protein [Casimicrobiaceae bacterium]
MPLSVLISAWLFGALGGVHCLAMCGGFAAAAAARDGAQGSSGPVPLRPAAAIVRHQLAYHVGRVLTYAALGAVFGTAGAAVLNVAVLLPLQRTLYVVANLLLLLLGASIALGTPRALGLQRAGAKLFGAVLPALRPLLARSGVSGRIALGLVWGFVPCALVYGVLPLALFAGGAWQGALVMLAFGAGTVPTLAAAGLALRLPRRALGARWRYLAAATVIAFSLLGIYRSLFMAGALSQGPFF